MITRVMFVNLGGQEQLASMRLLDMLRRAGIASEIYPDSVKFKKQMEYANRRQIPYVAIVGSDELAAGKVTLKDMRSGEQISVPFGELLDNIRQ